MLSSVSETALITLKSRVVETLDPQKILNDTIAIQLYNSLENKLIDESAGRIFKKKLPRLLTRYISMRSRKFDQYTQKFIDKYPDGLIVSLGCGFDTRYWRTHLNTNQYIELDLPDVMQLKKDLLSDEIKYRTIGLSVLDHDWISQIRNIQTKHVLFLAEGLFMYLPESEVVNLVKRLADQFNESELVMEVVKKKYTQGFNKKIVEMKMKNSLGSEAGASFSYGITGPDEIESYHNGLKVMSEWSYFEENDLKPALFKLFKYSKLISRTQWTMQIKIT